MDEALNLDITRLSDAAQKLQENLLSKVKGQERAIRQIMKAYVPTTVSMHRSGRPLGVFLFLGPTGVGKSETVKVFAQVLLGKRDNLTKIDCNEFQEDHEVMKLLGAPPSYVGYNDKPRLAQENIDQYQTKTTKLNIILFDEIEKATPRLFDSILSILGDGGLTLGSGKFVDFSRSFIFLTSNLGSHEVRRLIEGSGIGFKLSDTGRDDLDQRIYKASRAAVDKKFRPEFINRLDKIVVFRSLSEATLREIMQLELNKLQWRIYESPLREWSFAAGEPMPPRRSIHFKLTPSAFNFVLKEGTSDLYGARELNRTLDRYVAFPLASLISSHQLVHGDKVRIDYVDGDSDLTFTKDGSTLIQ